MTVRHTHCIFAVPCWILAAGGDERRGGYSEAPREDHWGDRRGRGVPQVTLMSIINQRQLQLEVFLLGRSACQNFT